MALNSLTDRLSEQLEYVVARRQQNLDYLKRAHQGKVHWSEHRDSSAVSTRHSEPELSGADGRLCSATRMHGEPAGGERRRGQLRVSSWQPGPTGSIAV